MAKVVARRAIKTLAKVVARRAIKTLPKVVVRQAIKTLPKVRAAQAEEFGKVEGRKYISIFIVFKNVAYYGKVVCSKMVINSLNVSHTK